MTIRRRRVQHPPVRATTGQPVIGWPVPPVGRRMIAATIDAERFLVPNARTGGTR